MIDAHKILEPFSKVALSKIEFLLGQGGTCTSVVVEDKFGAKATIDVFGKITWLEPPARHTSFFRADLIDHIPQIDEIFELYLDDEKYGRIFKISRIEEDIIYCFENNKPDDEKFFSIGALSHLKIKWHGKEMPRI